MTSPLALALPDGRAARPYDEWDAVNPISEYGRSKLGGEIEITRHAGSWAIVRTSWVVSPFGGNFVTTMLRLATERPVLSVVDDQRGAPTFAPHLASAILDMSQQMAGASGADPRWGLYQATAHGDTTWCGLAREVFAIAVGYGVRVPAVVGITTAEYPTAARRPANSRLDGGKLAAQFGITLPQWQDGARACVERLLAATDGTRAAS